MPLDMHPRFAERATAPRYTFPEASRLTERPSRTLRRWALGHHRIYKDQPTHDEPLIRIDGSLEPDERPLSFLNLIELRFLASYRRRASLPAIRRALDYAAKELGFDRPLLQAEFKVHGQELFLKYAESDDYFINASRSGQMTWPRAVDVLLDSIDYDEDEHAAYRWWPLGKKRPVLLDTRLNAGHPSTAESAVRTDVIALRLRNGWSTGEITEDLAAGPDEVAAARELEHAA